MDQCTGERPQLDRMTYSNNNMGWQELLRTLSREGRPLWQIKTVILVKILTVLLFKKIFPPPLTWDHSAGWKVPVLESETG